MYYKCSWCKTRISSKPTYYTQGFTQLMPGFEVYCSAGCSLDAYQSKSISRVPLLHDSENKFFRKS